MKLNYMTQPSLQHVLIKPDDTKTITSGGIIIPEPSRSISNTGTILAIATDIEEVNVGDRVMYEKKGMLEVEDGWLVNIERVMTVL